VEQYVDGVIVCKTHQVHGNGVHILKRESPSEILNGDAFITAEPNVPCFVRTADCVPILIADPVQKAVGAVHAGWRGVAADVTGRAISVMRDAFGSKSSDILAAIGPAICDNCYEVGIDVIDGFQKLSFDVSPWIVRRDGDNPRVDLRSIVRRSLLYAGISADNIDMLNICTSCSNADLASYRRDKTDVRQISFILLNA